MKKSNLLKIIQEEINAVLKETTYAGKTSIPQLKKDPKYSTLNQDGKMNAEKELKSGSTVELEEDSLNEMAKITGRLEAAIKKVIGDNKELEGLALKKIIRKDEEVEDALEGDTMYDNQLNKFIAAVKGERVIGQRGRKSDPNKPEPTPKEKKEKVEKPTPSPTKTNPTSTPKPSSKSSTPTPTKDDEEVKVDTSIKAPTGDAEIEAKLKDVIAKKKAKLKSYSEGTQDYNNEMTALKAFLNQPSISKYIKNKTVSGSNPYSINNILKDIK
jgi:hypothetical protein